MRGTVLGFDPAGNAGAITGADGRRYDFLRAEWRGPGLPRPGESVDFLAGDAPFSTASAGQARQVWPVAPEATAAAQGPVQPFTWGWFLFSFRGRISRRPFWLRWILPVLAAMFATGFVAALVLGERAADIVNGLLSLALAWPGFAVGAKRCHDRGRSGWWQLLGFIPVIGMLWYLIDLGCLRGQPGGNRFGPDPLAPDLPADGAENRAGTSHPG